MASPLRLPLKRTFQYCDSRVCFYDQVERSRSVPSTRFLGGLEMISRPICRIHKGCHRYRRSAPDRFLECSDAVWDQPFSKTRSHKPLIPTALKIDLCP